MGSCLLASKNKPVNIFPILTRSEQSINTSKTYSINLNKYDFLYIEVGWDKDTVGHGFINTVVIKCDINITKIKLIGTVGAGETWLNIANDRQSITITMGNSDYATPHRIFAIKF